MGGDQIMNHSDSQDLGQRDVELGISIAPSSRETMDRFVSVVANAESKGVAHAWILDSQILYQNAYIALGILARETHSIGIGPGVTNLVTRHETVVANAMSTLAAIAPGRVVIGVGTGDSSVRPIGLKPLRVAHLRTRIQRLRALVGGEDVESNGLSFRVAVVAEQRPKIFVAATLPKMLELAGAVADGVIIVGAADPDFVRMQMAAIDRGAESVGREPQSVERDLWQGLAIGEGPAPTRLLASYAATQSRFLLRWPQLPSSLATFMPDMERVVKSYDFGEHLRVGAQHGDLVSDELVRRIAIAGTLEECADRVRSILETNPTRLSFTLLPRGREKRLEEIVTLWDAVKKHV